VEKLQVIVASSANKRNQQDPVKATMNQLVSELNARGVVVNGVVRNKIKFQPSPLHTVQILPLFIWD
jgi:hypothetical protein